MSKAEESGYGALLLNFSSSPSALLLRDRSVFLKPKALQDPTHNKHYHKAQIEHFQQWRLWVSQYRVTYG
tara:strand:- start:1 stop:210 length:210 start_codon:yes stop_codon:yes gene_type:complete